MNDGVGLLKFSLPIMASMFAIHSLHAVANPNLRPAMRHVFERLDNILKQKITYISAAEIKGWESPHFFQQS